MDLLGDYRTEIDKIDKEMTKLLEKRMNISKSISKYNMEHDMQIFHPEREKIVIEKNKGYLENKEYGDLVESYYDNLMYLSRLVQQKEIYSENNIYTKPYKNDRENLVVGYQGVPGSFGNEAMLKYFKNIKEAKSYEKFEDVFKAVEDGEIEYGILPVENSSTGGIGTVEDLLKEYNLYIVGEECIRISQNLVGIKGATVDDIKEVYSHPQGLAQSSEFLYQHRYIEQRPFQDTAMAAKYVMDSKDPTKAAIASPLACKLYGLEMLKENVQNKKNNRTRFMVISKELICPKESDKVSVIFTLPHQVGTLDNMLQTIKQSQINMDRIESRPIETQYWQYYFYIDFEGNMHEERIQRAINKMKANSTTLKVLGNYKRA